MISSCETEKVVIKQCHTCQRRLSVPDTFCRWCGVHQGECPVAQASAEDWRRRKTKVLRNEEEIAQSLSSLPLNTLAQNVAVKTGSLRLNRFGVLVIGVLIAIPMWLLIILLSPFDAYTSAKAASIHMSIR
jgi:hypothetical protein